MSLVAHVILNCKIQVNKINKRKIRIWFFHQENNEVLKENYYERKRFKHNFFYENKMIKPISVSGNVPN